MIRVDRPFALAAGALFFYFVLNQEYPVALIPALLGVWMWGIRADLKSTFGRMDMLRYESNKLLVGCVQKYGTKRAAVITIAYEIALVVGLSMLLNRSIGFNILDFMFVAGVFGVYHLYCARSNDNFKP